MTLIMEVYSLSSLSNPEMGCSACQKIPPNSDLTSLQVPLLAMQASCSQQMRNSSSSGQVGLVELVASAGLLDGTSSSGWQKTLLFLALEFRFDMIQNQSYF
ncbi:hypothetical protein FGO68_gene11868 [Halteria grandinella]|uniref:Uncharacterized protein n=1 Tax=Halteria grandinella TaxID=5974 RepID=A0A8J8NNW0_HALGN|nr:hypothetical protein FGO68_gene11868 [Halteria grandinella]